MGTGSVKGFATMLIVSTISTIILIVFVTKLLLSLLVGSGWLNDKLSWFGVKKAHVPDVSKGQERFYFGFFKNFDFVKNAKYFIIASVTVLVIGVGCMAFQGMKGNGILNWGIDFTSGTKLTVQSDTAISRDKLNDQLKSLGTVSYTHLDVYKRQEQLSAAILYLFLFQRVLRSCTPSVFDDHRLLLSGRSGLQCDLLSVSGAAALPVLSQHPRCPAAQAAGHPVCFVFPAASPVQHAPCLILKQADRRRHPERLSGTNLMCAVSDQNVHGGLFAHCTDSRNAHYNHHARCPPVHRLQEQLKEGILGIHFLLDDKHAVVLILSLIHI